MSFRPLLSLSALLAISGASAATACGSDETSPAPSPADAGADTSIGPVGANEAKQTGRIVRAVENVSVGGATVSIAGKTATTNDDGFYEIVVPKDTPYRMSVTAEEHYKLNEQEWILKSDTLARGDTSLLGTSIANILASFLPNRDAAKGLLVVRINPLPPCDSEQGATLSLDPPGDSKVTYFAGGRPNPTASFVTKDETFSAAIYDVTPNTNVKVVVNSPLCEEVPFPVDYQNVTYTGNQQTEPGEVLSYIRVFIGPKKAPVDAGAD
ncbi:MAG: hypothetical protein KF819_27805 [Labilithrix sp.]|nr:hypothetical protein [Labilithrix sp.]